MIKKLSFYLVLTVASTYLLSGCGSKHDSADEMSAPKINLPAPAPAPPADGMATQGEGTIALADSQNSTDFISSSAASQPKGDSTRKFIRTANVKFKVGNVIKTTSVIEDIVAGAGGFVAHTNLTSNQDNKTLIPLSEDSSLETTYYTVTNSMTLRVPDTKLDSTLRAIAATVEYLDYRIISAQDVSLDFLANSMAEQRLAMEQRRLAAAIDRRGKKLVETLDGEERLAGRGEESDNHKLSTLTMMDRVKFSTVELSIYQRQAVAREMLPNDLNITAYEPGFGTKLEHAFEYGWSIFAAFLLAIAKLWGFILFAIILYIVYKRFKPAVVEKPEVRPVSVGQK